MFVAASTRCFAELTFWEALHQINDLEFDKVEIWLDDQGTLKPADVLADPDEFVQKVREQTRLSPVAFTLAHEVDRSSFQELCRVAKALRITQFIVPSAPLGTPFNTEIDRLRELVQTATVDGIRVAIKTQSGRLTADAHTAVELCQSVEKLGIAFDPSYFLSERNPDAIVELVAPHTLHVHLRDSTQSQVQVQTGLGEIDYSSLISLLERHRYARALSVELLPELMDMSLRPLELRKLRMLVDSLL